MKRSFRFSFIAAALLVALSPLTHAQATYRLQQISPTPSPPDIYTYWIDDINDKGEVVGGAYATEGLWNWVWRHGVFTRLPGLPNASQINTAVGGINNRSQIVGTAERSDGIGTNVIWHHGRIRDIGGDMIVNDINTVGLMVAKTRKVQAGQPVLPLLRFGTYVQQMETLPGTDYSDPRQLNELGMSCGYSQSVVGRNHPVMWNWTQIHDIVLPAGAYDSDPNAINNLGAVALRIRFNEGQTARAAVWQDGQLTELPPISEATTFSEATGINDAGQVVGLSGGVPVIWQNGTVQDLNDLISPADPLYGSVQITNALMINNRGQIVAEGTGTGFLVNYLLTPSGHL